MITDRVRNKLNLHNFRIRVRCANPAWKKLSVSERWLAGKCKAGSEVLEPITLQQFFLARAFPQIGYAGMDHVRQEESGFPILIPMLIFDGSEFLASFETTV